MKLRKEKKAHTHTKFMNLTIRKKLISSFLLVAILFGVASFISFHNLKQTNDSYSYLVGNVSEVRSISQNIDTLISNQASDLNAYLLFQDEAFIGDLNTNNREIIRLIDQAKELSDSEQTLSYLDQLTTLNNIYLSEAERAINISRSMLDHGIRVASENVVPISREMREVSEALTSYEGEMLATTQAATNQSAQNATILVVIVSGLAFILAITSGIFVSNLIAKPIIQLSALAKQVASGDLSIKRLNIKSKDEIHELNESFNQMTDNLREMISSIQTNSEQVAASSEQLNASANESAKATDQITESIQSVASGAEQQAESTASANDTANEISAGVEQIARNIFSVSEATSTAQQKSNNGLEIVEKTVTQMNAIHNQTNATTTVISNLEEKSSEIGSIISLITTVSDQTNLLALNAAIEAARAGEHGRGFAVVADEVRKLAEQSHKSAGQISTLIQDIQNDIQRSVSSMAEGSNTVQQGLVYATEAGKEFKEISVSINEISAQVDEVSVAVQQIAMGTMNMLESIKEASAIADNASSYSQNVAAAAEEQTATMQEISASAEMLSRMAEELQETVRKFTL
ncbi:methyl-accepting chemotaxis protein [Halalkalibacter alkaliphilus]|uniref:Methyl-accepting chemotaxis protein n=1 Tax=Halalkalibacter alkaliphilus TaxID=2917993 RepID=A0A9X2A4H7_9BACI|nr:methyl-accepting chemotaxis protein [Halalkalibacter alkaliphilus]MCL7746708.1 methyl-accepting chemotaxis protein [Halalkalibacter alkaliphilus]